MKRAALALILLFSVLFAASAQDDPGLCRYTDAAGRPPLLPRYEAHNQRLVLVDWTTGADVLELAGSLPPAWTLGWSADCRYLAAAVGTDPYETVVWDTVTGVKMGSVPDARGQAHRITWGIHNNLVVETRNGAVVWNVPAGTRFTLDTGFHTTQLRNFFRLRWDAENNQLIGDLAVGGRKVYDLASGQEVVLSPAAVGNPNQAEPIPARALTIGGRLYDCRDIYLDYIRRDGLVVVRGRGGLYSYHPIAMVETIPSDTYYVVDSTITTEDCRYRKIVLMKWGRIYETVIYDLKELRRVASFGEGNRIAHPFMWLPGNRQALIASKDGVFLWDIPTDARTRLIDRVAIGAEYNPRLDGWNAVRWDTASNRLYIIFSADRSAYSVYELSTGILIERVEGLGSFPAQPASTSSTRNIYATTSSDFFDFGTDPVSPAAPIDSVSGQRLYAAANYLLPGLPYGWRTEYLLPSPELPYDDTPFRDIPFQSHYGYKAVIYDSANGQTVLEIESLYQYRRSHPVLFWSPDGTWALVQTSAGYYAADLRSGTAVLLKSSSGLRTTRAPYWDFARGQIFINGLPGVAAFDLRTGEQRKHIVSGTGDTRNICAYYCAFSGVDANGEILWISQEGALGIVDLNTLNAVFLDEDNRHSWEGNARAISPDRRYAIAANYVLRVYDLANLAPDFEDRDPVHRWNLNVEARSVRFIDNVTVEITPRSGEIFRLNVETGERTTP